MSELRERVAGWTVAEALDRAIALIARTAPDAAELLRDRVVPLLEPAEPVAWVHEDALKLVAEHGHFTGVHMEREDPHMGKYVPLYTRGTDEER